MASAPRLVLGRRRWRATVGASSVKASMSSPSWASSRTVNRRCPARGWSAPKVRGTSPRARRPLAIARAAPPSAEVDQEEVGHRRTGREPARGEGGGKAGPLAHDARDVGGRRIGVAQGSGDDRHGRDADRTRRTVRLDLRDELRTRNREADAHPGEGVGLRRRPHRRRGADRRRAARRASGRRTRRTPRRGRRRARSAARRRRRPAAPPGGRPAHRPAPAARSGCSGRRARSGRRRRRQRGSRRRRGRSRDGRARGTRAARAGRCSVSTRYMA